MKDSIWELRDLGAPIRATQLLQRWKKDPDSPIRIDLAKTRGIYPNGAVAFASTLAFLKEVGADVELILPESDSSTISSIKQPFSVVDWRRGSGSPLTNTVWRYRSEQEAQPLANLFIEALRDNIYCEEGVIDAINWCLYEVMDNVFQHSSAEAGFVMMQLHRKQRLCVIAVGDTGIGIQKSLVVSKAADLAILRDPGASIDHALKQGVTSKNKTNQGNGLFGLRRSVELNGGELSVQSGWGRWCLRGGSTEFSTDRSVPLPDSTNHQSTLVDWRLDCSKKVRIDEALGGKTREGGALLESIEGDDGAHRVEVQAIEESLGSRKLGSEIRVRLQNYMAAGATHVVLDFRGVGVVSSSFADEVLAKLAVEMGELEYRRRVIVEGASITNRRLIETAVSTRLSAAGAV